MKYNIYQNERREYYLGLGKLRPLGIDFINFKYKIYYDDVINKITEYNGIFKGTFQIIYFKNKDDAAKLLDFLESLIILDKLVN